VSLLPALVLAATFLSQSTLPAAPSPEQTQAITLESQQAARLMLDSPDLLAVYRSSFETAVAKGFDRSSRGSQAKIEPDLRAKLVRAAGDEYVGELRAGLEPPVAAAGRSLAAHMQKYELDQFVAFLPTSGGRKFMAYIYRNALAIRDGVVSQEQAGEALSKLLTLTEQQDIQSAMSPELLQHWKQAAEEFRPALSAWASAASERVATKMEAITTRISREYYRSKEQSK